MIPLSTSRIYIFGVGFVIQDLELAKKIHVAIKERFPELTYMNIEIKRVKQTIKPLTTEIHINHLLYLKQRFFDQDTTNLIRIRFVRAISMISELQYDQIQLINDEYDRRPSLGLSRQPL